MKTLIINGSTRRGGNTDALTEEFSKHLDGEYMMITSADSIAPCRDCRYCFTHDGCAVHDAMADVYRYLSECDNIVIASPVWFMSLSGVTLDIASRFQAVWAASVRGAGIREKNGAIILAGAQSGTEAPAEKAARAILRTLGVSSRAEVLKSMRTDDIAVSDDEEILAMARAAAQRLNEAYKQKRSQK